MNEFDNTSMYTNPVIILRIDILKREIIHVKLKCMYVCKKNREYLMILQKKKSQRRGESIFFL